METNGQKRETLRRNIRANKEKYDTLWNKAKNFLDDHTDKNGKISANDVTTFEAMEKELEDLRNEIQADDSQEKLLATYYSQPIGAMPTEFHLGGGDILKNSARIDRRKESLNIFQRKQHGD